MKVLTAMLLMAASAPVAAQDCGDTNKSVCRPVVRLVPTQALVQMPFEHPTWEPTEEQKKAALLKGYHLNGDRMCCGYIELPVEQKTELAPATQKNMLDAVADVDTPMFRPDACERHHMHKVMRADGKSWRCKK